LVVLVRLVLTGHLTWELLLVVTVAIAAIVIVVFVVVVGVNVCVEAWKLCHARGHVVDDGLDRRVFRYVVPRSGVGERDEDRVDDHKDLEYEEKQQSRREVLGGKPFASPVDQIDYYEAEDCKHRESGLIDEEELRHHKQAECVDQRDQDYLHCQSENTCLRSKV